MIPDKNQIEELLKKYAPNNAEYLLISEHGQIVAEIALECAKNVRKKVDLKILEAASKLHDIGSYPFLAAKYFSEDYNLIYSQHALLGAKILEYEGVDEKICKIVETHVKLGLTEAELTDNNFPLPIRNYEPSTIEGRLVCYGDRFHSKMPAFYTLNSYIQNLIELNLPLQAEKMKNWSQEFGIPNIDALAKKYNHPVI